jgi:hypothetical protein
MTAIETFIADIAAEPQPLLNDVSGSLLFEIRDNDATHRVRVEIDRGTVRSTPAEPGVDADARATADRRLIEDLVQGRANAMAAMLRGDIHVEGSAELLVLFQRLFPGPQGAATSVQP